MVEIIDNFFSKDEFQKVWDKIDKVNFSFPWSSVNMRPIYIDFLKDKLVSEPNTDIVYTTTRMEEKINSSQKWHVDISGKLGVPKGREWTGFALQWMIYMGGDFEGGDLHIKEGKEERIIKPISNRLVIIDPFETKHKVDPVKGFRYSLSGFIYKYRLIN